MRHTCTPTQAALAEKTRSFIHAHLSERITIEQISVELHVSATQLKICFKNIYGMPIYAYIRSKKMQQACQLLKTTESTVLDIGNRMGYDNGSKFARAFRSVVGVGPREYRRSQQMKKQTFEKNV
ncbi:MAG: AraC family transcriptional regulator [Lachnospiraceae bacterium]|nr:AraC family transcriptional regulator [Lachnospiraceae bacterium]